MPVCIRNTSAYTEACKFQHFHINHTHSAHPRPPKTNFSQDHLKKLSQFKPVLASGKNLKNLKFPPFYTNLTHFYFKFLKDFYIFGIYGPSGSLWYLQIQDSSSINREKYCLQEMVVLIQFLLHSNHHNSLINNIKIIFL